MVLQLIIISFADNFKFFKNIFRTNNKSLELEAMKNCAGILCFSLAICNAELSRSNNKSTSLYYQDISMSTERAAFQSKTVAKNIGDSSVGNFDKLPHANKDNGLFPLQVT